MKKYKYHLAITFLLVLILSSFKPLHNSLQYENSNNLTNSLQIIHTKYNFLNIFITNFISGLILSLLGFLTGGILTLIIILWNLLLLWFIYSSALSSHQDIDLILYLSKHLPIEIYAFILFSIIGFRGFRFYKKLIIFQQFDRTLFPCLKELFLPVFLLIIASFIEVS